MNIRRAFFWFIAIAAVLIALVFWFAKKQPVETPAATSTETNAAPTAATTPGQPASVPVPTTAPPAQAAANAAAPSKPDKGEQIKEGLATLNDVSIAFYGKLEDQFGNPVGGAQIAGSTIIYNGIKTGGERVSVTSDANGFFKIDAGKGESLGIMPRKEGYVLATTGTYFKYSYMYADHFTPDPNNPTVIKMWKLQGAEPLVGIGKEYKLPFTNAPLFFDLVTGNVSDNGGDLEIIITRAPGSLSKRSPGDWSIRLKPVNGGIIESDFATSRITYEAPAEGYQDDYLVRMNHDDPAWCDGIDKEFFLKSRNGQVYGKLYLVFGINREPNDLLYFQFKGVANTNGSRNWEATVPQ
jgi:hypothetical protein